MIALEFKIPIERFSIEKQAIICGTICDVEGKSGFKTVVLWMNEANLGNLHFSAARCSESEWPTMPQKTTRESSVDIDNFM